METNSFFKDVVKSLNEEQRIYLYEYRKYCVLLSASEREAALNSSEEYEAVPLFTYAFYELKQLYTNKKQKPFWENLLSRLDPVLAGCLSQEDFFAYPYQQELYGKEINPVRVEVYTRFLRYYERLLIHLGDANYINTFNECFNFDGVDTKTKTILQALELSTLRVALYSIYKTPKWKLNQFTIKQGIPWVDGIYIELVKLHAASCIYSLLKLMKENKIILDVNLNNSIFTPKWLKDYLENNYQTKELDIWILSDGMHIVNKSVDSHSSTETVQQHVAKPITTSSAKSNNLVIVFEEFYEWINSEDGEQERDKWLNYISRDVQDALTLIVSRREHMTQIFGSDWKGLNFNMFIIFFRSIVYNTNPFHVMGLFQIDAVRSFIQLSLNVEGKGREFAACWAFDAVTSKSDIQKVLAKMKFNQHFIEASLLELAKRHYHVQVVETTNKTLFDIIQIEEIKAIKSFDDYLGVIVSSLDQIIK
jgi:hypothetical protein